MSIVEKTIALWKKHFIIAPLVSWIIPIIATILLVEPTTYYVKKHLNKKLIHIKVVSVFNGSRYDVVNYANSENIGYFNLKQDDPLISSYWVYKIKILNKGIAVSENLKFKLDLRKFECKIVDIKTKVVLPLNKNIYISNSILDLEWSLEEYKDSKYLAAFIWDKQPREIIGSNVYKSILKNVGYGRVNNELIKDNYYIVGGDPSKQEQMYYFAMENVQCDGKRSPLTRPIHIIASAAFRPFYKGLYIIENNRKPPSPRKHSFKSLEEAVRSNKSDKIFLISEEKSSVSNITEYLKLSNNNNKVIFLDDIKNLEGKVDINIPSGLDENAEIDLYILCKTMPGEIPNININLEGQPDIHLTMDNSALIKSNKNIVADNIINEGIPIDVTKYRLTPRIITTYYGQKSIFLAWEFAENNKRKGVRIFRSDVDNKNQNNKMGDEIYEGPFGERAFKYKFNSEKWEKDKDINMESYNPLLTNEPPQRKRKKNTADYNDNKLTPMAPSVFRIVSDEKDEGKIMYYYEDKKVKPGKQYLYTVYIYDENYIYSYPTTVSALLDRISYSPYCYPIDQ